MFRINGVVATVTSLLLVTSGTVFAQGASADKKPAQAKQKKEEKAATATDAGTPDPLLERALLWGTEKSSDPGSDVAGPPPIEQVAALDFFAGKWNCKGRVFGGPGFGDMHWSDTATFTMKRDLFRWYNGRFEEKRTKEIPNPLIFVEHQGYNFILKKFVRRAITNVGDIVDATSDGWSGDTLVWSGTWTGDLIVPGPHPFKQTITREGKKQFSYLMELEYKGNWLPAIQHTCKK